MGRWFSRAAGLMSIVLVSLAVAGPLGFAFDLGGHAWGAGFLSLFAEFALTGYIIAAIVTPNIRGSYALSVCFRAGIIVILPLVIIAGHDHVSLGDAIRLGLVTFQVGGVIGFLAGSVADSAWRRVEPLAS